GEPNLAALTARQQCDRLRSLIQHLSPEREDGPLVMLKDAGRRNCGPGVAVGDHRLAAFDHQIGGAARFETHRSARLFLKTRDLKTGNALEQKRVGTARDIRRLTPKCTSKYLKQEEKSHSNELSSG